MTLSWITETGNKNGIFYLSLLNFDLIFNWRALLQQAAYCDPAKTSQGLQHHSG
jgi:hypothetical protein